MKTKLLVISLFGSLAMHAQDTHMVNWSMATPAAEANITIHAGDIVMWTWTDNSSHTVTSVSGTETFNSGIKSGVGQTFSHTFNTVGSTAYRCNIHSMMTGTVTVEAVMGVEDLNASEFKYFPNPATDVLTLTAAENIDKVDVYDSSGKLLMSSVPATATVKVHMDNFASGTYFIKAFVGGTSKEISIVKQ